MDDELHEKGEPHLRPGKLYSMLDLLGASLTCDECGRWQRIPSLSPDDAMLRAAELGWHSKDGRDLCKHCAARP